MYKSLAGLATSVAAVKLNSELQVMEEEVDTALTTLDFEIDENFDAVVDSAGDVVRVPIYSTHIPLDSFEPYGSGDCHYPVEYTTYNQEDVFEWISGGANEISRTRWNEYVEQHPDVAKTEWFNQYDTINHDGALTQKEWIPTKPKLNRVHCLVREHPSPR